MREVVVVSAVRTAVGTYGGSLKNTGAADLGGLVIKTALNKAGIDPVSVDEVFMGCVLQAGLGQNVARQSMIKAGLPVEVPATTINMVCGSGLKSIIMAAAAITAGEIDIAVAGGTENMSAAPYKLDGARWGLRMGDGTIDDLMISDGLWCAFNNYHMGITAENIAERYGLTREMQDKFALESQDKAFSAIEKGKFKDEIVPVAIQQKKGDTTFFDTDEHPRKTSLEALSNLKPAFKSDGTVTAGNASGLNDSAAAVLLMSRDKAKEIGLKPIAAIRSHASVGVDPAYMGTGPIPASKKALSIAGWSVDDLDLVEANEAFAAQALCVIKALKLNEEKVNVNGGAIALGHPIGASGTRIFVSLLHEMQKRQAKRGLATLCIGGGQGIACTVERD